MEAFLAAHKEGIFYGLLGLLVFGYILNKLVLMLVDYLSAYIDRAYAHGDAEDDKLLTAFLKWVIAKCGPKVPGDCAFPDKMYAAAMKIISFVPLLPVRMFLMFHADKIKALCQKSYDLGIQAVEKEVKEHTSSESPEPPAGGTSPSA